MDRGGKRKTRDSLNKSWVYRKTKPFLISELMIALIASVSLGIKIRAFDLQCGTKELKKKKSLLNLTL
jgi:hypothetical protein